MSLMTSSKKGISSNQLHRMLGVTLKTARFMSHRIREACELLVSSQWAAPEKLSKSTKLLSVGSPMRRNTGWDDDLP